MACGRWEVVNERMGEAHGHGDADGGGVGGDVPHPSVKASDGSEGEVLRSLAE